MRRSRFARSFGRRRLTRPTRSARPAFCRAEYDDIVGTKTQRQRGIGNGGEITCCSGHGTCNVEAIDPVGEYPTFLGCACEEGLAGGDCSYDTAVTFFGGDPPGFCAPNDPGCWFTSDADDQCLSFDMLSDSDNMKTLCGDTEFPSIGDTRSNRLAAMPPKPFRMEICAFYPAADGQANTWAEGEFPVWLVNSCNGDGSCDPGEFSGLLSHVARNGVISVVMADDTNQVEIATRGEMLSCLRRKLPGIMVGNATIGTKWNNRLAYGGLSRGGEAAVMATGIDAELDAKMDPTPPAPPPAAVISLAPTVHCADNTGSCGYGMNTDEAKRGLLKDGTTPAFLVLEGSRDGDGTGGGLSLHDFASAEGMDDPPANAMIKAMMWAFDVPHLDWQGAAGTRAELVGRTYAVAFLHWHLNGVASHRSLFTGTTVTPCIADPGSCGYGFDDLSLFPQFREGGTVYGGRRQVVRYFRGELDTNEGTGPVEDSANAVFVNSQGAIPQENLRGMSVELTTAPMMPASIELRLDIADVNNPAPLDSLAGSLSTLSFRLSKLLGGAPPLKPNTSEGAADSCDDYIPGKNLGDLAARVTLFDADGGASELDSSVFRPIAAPDIGPEVREMDGAYVYACDVTDFWTTVRIPLTAFQGVDLKRLQRVRFELLASDNGNTPVRALLDSVELVGHTSEPVCGNGDDEQGEQCDGADLGGLTCEDLGLISGVLACKDTCEFDTSGCEMPPVCGNGLREPGEQCDGPDLGGSTCEDFDLVSGTLACTNACEFDTSDCEQDDGDCPEGAPGCPGGPCLDIPTSMGVAAYYQNGKYCNDSNYICREDFPGEWTCHDCTWPLDSRVGCPCLPNNLACPPELTCVHNLPDLPGIDVAARGACWAEIPAGYCGELCEATDRICGSTVEETAVCIIEECAPDYCEFEAGTVCNRDSNQCDAVCDDLVNPCNPNEVCTTWGECWV